MGNLSAIISADTTGFKKSVEEAKNILEKFSKAEDDAVKQIREVSNVSDSQVAAFQRVNRTLSKVSSGAMSTAQSEKALSSQVKELRIQYANLSDTAKQSDFGRAIQRSCEDATKYLNQVRQQLDAVKDKSSDTNTTLNTSSSSFDKLAGFVSKYAVQLGVASTALKVAKDAFLSTETGADNWGKAVAGAEAAYKVFLTTLNNGNWSNFFNNLNDAIGGAMELYDKLDRLGSIKTNNQAAIAIVEKELSELRLKKQQGENVDAEIKRAEGRLAFLRKQEVDAGKEAGRDQIIQAIKQQYANVSDSVAGKFADSILKNGQPTFDEVDKQIEQLQKKAGTKLVDRVVGSGQYGNSIVVKDEVIALENLTDTEREWLKILQAVHDAEGDMTAGIVTYTNAVKTAQQANEATFKYNKWGNNGGGGGTTTSTPTRTSIDLTLSPISVGRTEKQIKDEIKTLQQKIENTPDGVLKIALIAQKQDLEEELQNLGKNPIKVEIETQANNMDLSGIQNVDSNTTKNPLYGKEVYQNGVDGIYSMIDASKILDSTWNGMFKNWGEKDFGEKFFALSDAIFSTISAVQSFVNGLQQMMEVINNLSAISSAASKKKIAENAQETSSNITTMATEEGKAITSATASGAKLPFPANIAAIAAGVAAVIGAIAMIGSFAEGGIIKGSNTIGDMNIARVNSGEMILNGSQQKHLFNMLNQGGTTDSSTSGEVHFKIQGKDLVGVLSNYNKKVGKVL